MALLLGLQLLVVVSAVLVAVLLWIVRPIKKMSDRLHVMDADSTEPLAIPQGQESTEIGRLVDDINQLGRSLLVSRDEEHLLRMQREFGERKYRAIFENADSGIFVIDQRMLPESCNLAFYRQLSLIEYSLNGREIRLAELSWRKPDDVIAFVRQCLALNTPGSADFEYVIGEDEIRWFNLALTPIGEHLLQGLLSDISRHKQAELSAQQEAITDVLSGLLNRNGFLQKLDEIILECSASPDAGFSLMLLDLDPLIEQMSHHCLRYRVVGLMPVGNDSNPHASSCCESQVSQPWERNLVIPDFIAGSIDRNRGLVNQFDSSAKGVLVTEQQLNLIAIRQRTRNH